MVSAGDDRPSEEDTSIDVLPTRMRNWADAHGVETLGALARIPPDELMGQRNLGRLTIHQTRKIIEARLGVRWEDVSSSGPPEKITAKVRPPGRDPKGQPLAPGEDVSLDDLRLPTRMRNWADRHGIESLRALARIPPDELLEERNLGKTSIQQTRAIIEAYLGIPWTGERPQPSAEEAADAALAAAQRERRREALLGASFLEGLRMLVAELPQNERVVLEACTGLVGPARSREDLARRFVVQVPAIHRWLRVGAGRLRHETSWFNAVRERVAQALPDGAVLLETLAADPWWAEIAALPETLDFFAGWLLDHHVIEVEGRRYLGCTRQSTFDNAWDDVRAKCAGVQLPAPRSAFHALLDPWAPRFGPVLTAMLRDRIDALLTLDPTDPGTGADPRVVRFGISQPEQARLFLQAAPEPVTIAELTARLGHCCVPGDALWFGSGLVGLEHHFPDLARWTRRLVPAAIRVMRSGPPGRQWHQQELHDALHEAEKLPAWLGPWHLGSILRRSGKVRWLRLRRFALLDAPGGGARIRYGAELLRILRDAGGPLSFDALESALALKTTVPPHAMYVYLQSPEFVRCAPSVYGLLDRDLPGGPEAITPAADHLVKLLSRRGRGLFAAEICAAVSALGGPYPRWTPEMCVSALRRDPRLIRAEGNDALGLSVWGDARVPTRRGILEECLDRGGGRARVSTVVRRYEEVFPKPSDRYWLINLASRCGARVRGKWIERRAGAGDGG
jgi:hypothetical protein